jgi:sarcosine oxidase subunit beta
MVDVRLPIESHPLQALVSEPIKPILPCVVMSSAVHAYCSQSDKGELVIGAGIDHYLSYTQRGGVDIVEHELQSLMELFPMFSRLRMLRQWGGVVDLSPDASPIISTTRVKGFYINTGWGTGARSTLLAIRIAPAQVPSSGRPLRAKARIGSQSLRRSMPLEMVVLSPPGRIRASSPGSCSSRSTGTGSAPMASRIRA